MAHYVHCLGSIFDEESLLDAVINDQLPLNELVVDLIPNQLEQK